MSFFYPAWSNYSLVYELFPQCSHMTRKRGVYYYRRRLPQPHKGEVTLSLRTKAFRYAEYLASVLDQSFQQHLKDNDNTMTTDLRSILRQRLQEALDLDLQQHHSAKPGEPVYASLVDPADDPVRHDLETIGYLLSDAREWLALRETKRVEPELSELMELHELPEDQRVPLGIGLLQVNVQQLEKAHQRLLGATEPIVLEDPASSVPAASLETQEKSAPDILFSEALPRFVEVMEKDKGWTSQTLNQNNASFRMFAELCGDKPVQSYSRRDLTMFYDMLRGLPSLWSKTPIWNELTPSQIVQETKAEDIDRLSMRTVKRHFAALSSFFAYLKRRGEYDGDNPAQGFEFPTKGRANAKRKMWEGEKLTALFSSPVWSGCLSKDRRSTPGQVIIKDEKYWLPILGLYHGNRLEEFAQLQHSDIKTRDGISYFDINADGSKQLKNEQSIRKIPIHPKVIDLGFLNYIDENIGHPNDQIFPELKPGGSDNKLGANFTKWWSRYRVAIGVYEKGLDYHSFRHGVTTKLYEADVSQAFIDELTGHEGAGTSQVTYKKEMPLKPLYDAISKVEWPEVRLKD